MIWPTLNYTDAPAAIEFLKTAFGFTANMVVANESDAAVIDHAQLSWPGGRRFCSKRRDLSGGSFDETP